MESTWGRSIRGRVCAGEGSTLLGSPRTLQHGLFHGQRGLRSDLAEMLDMSIICPFSFSILNMWLTWQLSVAETCFSKESKKLRYRDAVMDIYGSFL